MNDTDFEALVDRLGREGGPAGAVADLILAAAAGADTLDALLNGGDPPERETAAAAAQHVEPARVYLEQIAVRSFRGIGPGAKLPLEPGPGLTLVVGRNGSGKSSFAEGLELLLTGTNLRWEKRDRVWLDGWRNLHGDDPPALLARFRVDGEQQPLELRRRWSADGALDSGAPVEVSGPRTSWDELGWEVPLSQYRPLLSYNELGTMFSERAGALYDALSAVLGLQAFEELKETLRLARLEREKSSKTEKAERAQLKAALEATEDARAGAITTLLAKRPPHAGAIEQLVSGDDDVSDQALQPLASTALPTDGAETTAAFAAAAAEVQRLEATDAERLDALARLLTDAVRFHDAHGDEQTCPICGTDGVLDEGWSLRTQASIEELRHQSDALRTARQTLQSARSTLNGLFSAAIPTWLRAASDDGVDTSAAHEAWDAWAELLRLDEQQIAAGATVAADRLGAALRSAGEAAAAEIEKRDSAWRPTRDAVRTWLATATRAERDKDAVDQLKQAEAWMAALMTELRRERLQPVVAAAQANWDQLRHESNVSLGEVELKKVGNRRYASFDVTVDGTETSAFGVMSQGELSALAVSVFLPRASLPESPFGFIVIDDPVQSMDPAKVDGLARVLAEAAQQRQVVVFTHDERLPDAVRRLDIDARILHVQRRAKSKIEIVLSRPPSDRYVGEALAFAKTPDVSDEVRALVLPGLCRSAIEAACASRIRRRMTDAGAAYAAVEEHLRKERGVSAWLADAFELPLAKGDALRERVRRAGGDSAVDIVRLVTKGAHELVRADAERLAEGTKALVKAIEGDR